MSTTELQVQSDNLPAHETTVASRELPKDTMTSLRAKIAELSRELELKNNRIEELETHCPRMTDLFHAAEDTRCQCSLLDSVEASRCCSRWQKKVGRLEVALEDRDDAIAALKSDNRKMKAELLEFHQHKLQQLISEKDSQLAVLELQPSSQGQVASVRAERTALTTQLKDKIQQRVQLFRTDDAMGALVHQYKNCSKEQVCDVIRALELDSMRLKAYIDHLLALVLESHSSLLEGMPRIQQSCGIRLELLAGASLPELLEELHEKEKNSGSLQNYAALLLQRIMDSAPNLLQSVIHLNVSEQQQPNT